MKTTAIFFPFDLFGSAGAANGADALFDALEEMLADNRRERAVTRSRAYDGAVRTKRLAFEKLTDYEGWRERARDAVRRVWREDEFLIWTAGNHLGALPVYEEFGRCEGRSLVVQFDAHLDVQNFSDCTSELSHGNFLLHADGPLPRIVNVGHRDLLLPADHVAQTYQATFSAEELAIAPETVVRKLRRLGQSADRVFLDLDCDVFDPVHFPAVSSPVPFGIEPSLFLRLLHAVWSERVIGVAISEFDPGRDRDDRSLSLLVWLLEYVLLKRHEAVRPRGKKS